MKKIFKISGSLLLAMSLVLSSCLKDSSLTMDAAQSNSVVEFANTGSVATSPLNGAAPRFAIDLGALKVGDTTSFMVNVDYAGANKAPQDIDVTVDIDATQLATYNTAHAADGANYVIPPTALFTTTFPLTIRIPKGELFGHARISVKLPNTYNFNAAYALPLKITKVSSGVVSGNFGTSLYSLSVRNIFDGKFKVTGTFVDYTNGAFGASYPKTVYLYTVGASSNAYYDPDLNGGTFGYKFLNGSTGTYYGSWDPIFNFDASGNVTSVVNYYGQPSSNGRSAGLNPAGVNKLVFDSNGKPKTFDVSYYLLQPGTTIRSAITEHWEYLGSR